MNDEFLSRTDGRSTVSTAPVTATSAGGARAAPRALTASLTTALVALVLAAHWLDHGPTGWAIALALFVAAWIGQFYGHKVEGKKPSFLDDLQFLMIGPAWLMGFIYRRLGIGY